MARLRKIRIRSLIGLALSGGALLLLAAIFIPEDYPLSPWKPLPRTQYLERPDGTRIAWQALNPDLPTNRPAIIFLQGGPGGYISDRTMEMLKPFAAAGFNVYAYDQIGAGSSSRLKDIAGYTVQRHVEDLQAMVEHAGSGKVVLIGQSWGGILSALYAAAYPERVAGIIFTCPGPLPGISSSARGLIAPDCLRLRAPLYSNRQANDEASTMRTRSAAWIARHLGLRLMSDAEADAFQSTLNGRLAKSTCCDTNLAPKISVAGSGYYAQLMTVQSLSKAGDPRPVLRKLDIPVLILKGQCDNQSWGVTQDYRAIFNNSRLQIIPGAGHNIYYEQPEAYHEAVLRFLLAAFDDV